MGKERVDPFSCLAHYSSASAFAPCPPFLVLDPRLSVTFLSSGQAEFRPGYLVEVMLGELLVFSERDGVMADTGASGKMFLLSLRVWLSLNQGYDQATLRQKPPPSKERFSGHRDCSFGRIIARLLPVCLRLQRAFLLYVIDMFHLTHGPRSGRDVHPYLSPRRQEIS